MRRPSLSVKARIAVTTVALLAVTLGAVTALVSTSASGDARRSAEQLTTETAVRSATEVQGELARAFGTARDLEATLRALRATGATRAQADRLERTVLERHPDYLGVWSGWEPGAWDGKDAQFAGSASSDASGRYVSYWYRDGDSIAVSPLVDYETPGAGDYYVVPRDTAQEKVLDPYEYEVGGTTVLMTSLTAPVRGDGVVLGVVGVDIALDVIQEQVSRISVYGTGAATLLSSGGLVVAGPDAEAVGKPAEGALATTVLQAGDAPVRRTVETSDGAVLRVATPVELGTQDTWTLVVDVPQGAVLAGARELRNTVVAVALLSLLVAGGLAFAAARRLVRPVDALRRRLVEISEGDGDLTQRVDDGAQDEIGALGRAFNRFVEKVADTVREITRTSEELGASAQGLRAVSDQLASSTDATSARAAQLSAASRQVDASVQTVATGTEEMGATAREIAGSAATASRMAAEGVAAAAAAGSTVDQLGTSSAEIGEVVRVITSIAGQTNLLALNATIEAARAGEAGRGFAVVANEVKELAQETARATDDIIARIAAIQSDAGQASEALSRIASTIAAVDESQTSIATAVEEQAATVQSMAVTITQAADGSADMTAGLLEVDSEASRTSAAAGQTAASAADLQELAARLRTLVGDFRC